jgi:hypothetical protein
VPRQTLDELETELADVSQAILEDPDQAEEVHVAGSAPGFKEEQDDDGPDGLPSTGFSPINFNVTTRRISDIYSSFNDNELDTTPARTRRTDARSNSIYVTRRSDRRSRKLTVKK